jgi:hypothetical protein
MIEKIDNNQIQDILENACSNPNPVRNSPYNRADASLQTDYALLIEKAKQVSEKDTTAVHRARELILSGELERPENFRAAAEKIVTCGI